MYVCFKCVNEETFFFLSLLLQYPLPYYQVYVYVLLCTSAFLLYFYYRNNYDDDNNNNFILVEKSVSLMTLFPDVLG